MKKSFLKISQKNACVRVFFNEAADLRPESLFLIKLQASGMQFIKKDSDTGVFS